MIGGPLLFLAIAVFGIRALLGPPPELNPVDEIRAGRIRAGMTLDNVVDRLGAPSDLQTKEDGSSALIYRRTGWEQERKEFVQYEATVSLDASGRVIDAKVEKLQPPAPAGNSP